MRTHKSKTLLAKASLAASVLLLASGAAFGQVVNLTAKSTTTTLPDGTVVPMWGLFCNDAGSAGATCGTLRNLSPAAVPAAPLAWAPTFAYTAGQVVLDSNGNVQQVTIAGTSAAAAPVWLTTPGALTAETGGPTWVNLGTLAFYQTAYATTWAPPVITVPSGSGLTINLTNGLTFTNPIPTSLVIVGQLGGGLGTTATATLPPDHTNAQPVTWPIAPTAPGAAPVGVGTPPVQGNRVQSFASEVAPAGVAPVAPQVASGSALIWSALKPGTYLIESGTHPSIQGPMGLYGVVIVTTAPTAGAAGTAYGTAGTPGAVSYNAEVPLLLSEIDPLQNAAVQAAVNTAGFLETNVWSGQAGGCGNPFNANGTANPTYHTCYPPAVNYTPLYYLFNGVAFDKTHAAASVFPPLPSAGAVVAGTGSVLVRLVNAGLRMHVPSIVGSLTNSTTTATSVAGPVVTVSVVPGFALIAEDGNPLPGIASASRVQSEVFMPAGKTFDVMVNAPAAPAAGTVATGLPIYDRELSLSGNSTARDAGMLAYISINGAGVPAASAVAAAVARMDAYSVVPGHTLTVSDPGKGLIANDTNVYGVTVLAAPTMGALNLNPDGTFTYVPNAAWTPASSDSFTYCANGTVTAAVCSSGAIATATVNLGAATIEGGGGITMGNITYTANALSLGIKPPGILSVDKDGAGYPLTVAAAPAVTPSGGLTVTVDRNGGFNASVAAAGTYTFTYSAQNSQGSVSATQGTVTLVFQAASNLAVTVLDGKDVLAAKTNPHITPTTIGDYRWIIEEDRTFYVNPACTTNPPPLGCPGYSANPAQVGIVPTFGTNFHTSYMPLIAAGCTGPLSCEGGQTIFDNNPASPTFGTHINAVCDVGNGVCRPDATGNGFAQQLPSAVHLDPTKRYYFSVLPGDAGTPFASANLSADCTNGVASATSPGTCGHGMGGAPIPLPTCTAAAPGVAPVCTWAPLTVLTQPDPFPPSKLSVFVFEDDFPLNGENDAGGAAAAVASNEPGLGGFNITLFDDAGGTGDATGQMTYDMFNQNLVNALAGTPDPTNIDPVTHLAVDACPVSQNSRQGVGDPTQTGITGTIVTCPTYEADGKTLSPLAGQAVIANLMPGRYGVVATPGADRIARGEEWLQTNTLDGQKAHDSFLRIGEPSFFQEFGPAGYHVSVGFANPAIINGRKAGVCAGTDPNITGTCSPGNTLTGLVTTERMSRTPDQRLYSSGSNGSFAFTQCFVSFGDADGEDFAFTKCNADGTFTLTGLPDGDWRVTVFDQWNDMLVDGLSTPIRLGSATDFCPGLGSSQHSCNLGDIAMNQWQTNIYTSTFFDQNGNGVRDATEPGLTLVPTNIRFRDGSYSNFNNTDLNGNAGFNEVFPLFSWYVIETDWNRYKDTGVHVVYDAGGPADGTCGATTAPCGNSAIAGNMANTAEVISVPDLLRVPGAVYCEDADCSVRSMGGTLGHTASAPQSVCSTAPNGQTTCGTQLSTGRIDPPWVKSEGWQGFSGQNSYLEFGKKPFAAGENGGIRGEVIYASTRPFDDPQLLLHTSWTPDVPGVTVNLYKEGTAPDGTVSLTLVDTTTTSSWDDWAQGFRSDGMPNMNCPGQGTNSGANADLFYFTLFNQPMWLDAYNNGGTPAHTIPNNSQFKCYDGMHNWNQLQPAPFDGAYQFPSVTARDPVTGKPTPTGTNCKICVANTAAAPTDWDYGLPMLPNGKYVVEMVVPPGYELVKEEDKNILIGDNYIAPVTQEFPGLGSAIYIMPDQASVAAVYNANQGSLSAYNATNQQNPTQAFGRISSLSSHEGDTGSVESFWPCVGQARIVPDYISLFPQSHEVAPFAGALRNLCDRKEVILDDQSTVLAKFWVFTSTHVAAHYTGVITDDFTSEFDPFSPQFGEKFSPANLPVSIKDWSGQEISRTYADHWGTYDGITYSTWEVNPPNPTGYAPTMMVTCMNDPGTGATPDPLFNPAYSQFCYEIPFMPGQTQYMDTPVTPTSAFAGAGYNNPDCAYPDATPAVAEVDGDGVGPWVAAADGTRTLTITALGTVTVNNYGYSGPSATLAPFNQKTVSRHYGFGAQCTSPAAGNAACNTASGVTIGGVPATVTGWSDAQITVTVPPGVPACAVQQQALYGGSPAQCGELVITAGNGRQSVDAVTVTAGGKTPTHVAANGSLQSAIDAAAPGDLIIVDSSGVTTSSSAPAGTVCTTLTANGFCVPSAAVHTEILLMWKPVRLQGVGAASSIINANTHPAGKMDDWRRSVNCLFGLAINGSPYNAGNPYDPTGTYSCPQAGWNYFTNVDPNNAAIVNPQVDRLPLEAILGWDANLNGNLAELLQEPSLMGALEGAAVTVLSKGVNTHGLDPLASSLLAAFPDGSTPLAGGADCTSGPGGSNSYPSNFQCNPSSIDGLSVTNSSQGGGGIFVHGWGHNIQIANNRVQNNSGTLSGGINVGQGEFAPSYLAGGLMTAPGPCVPDTSGSPGGVPVNTQLPYCFNLNVNVHHNNISLNSSNGDELFSATPAGAGGISFCTGSDYYQFNYNWVCGNLSTGDGGGVGHLGFSYNGDIEHNSILFNQSTNPTIATNGGGILIMGTPDVDPPCGLATDADCVPPPNTISPSDGAGPGLKINANLIMGNAAESGSGGGLRLQHVNGSEVISFPTTPANWYTVSVTNNIIANNVAGWDGAGISLQDTLAANLINNTVMSNDTTASSGLLFDTIGAPRASSGGTNCRSTSTSSCPQPSGLVSIQNSAVLSANLPATVVCPMGHGNGGSGPGGFTNGRCRLYSVPVMENDVFWQNRAFYIGVGSLGTGYQNQQNVVALYNAFTTSRAASQPITGACVPSGGGGSRFWDIGVRGDTGPTNHSGSLGVPLTLRWSVLTSLSGGYGGGGVFFNTSSNPLAVSQYCNGSRVPPENGGMGYQVPAGIADATVPNPIFNLTPAATVDEGNNWVNMAWGPLSLSNPATGATLGDYALTSGSPAVDYIACASAAGPCLASGEVLPAPTTDFFGHMRPDPSSPGRADVGAVEYQGVRTAPAAPSLLSITPNTGLRGTVVPVVISGANLTGATAVTVTLVGGGGGSGGIAVAITSVNSNSVTANFTISGGAFFGARNVTVTTPSGVSNAVTFTVPGPTVTSITPINGLRGSGPIPVTITGTFLTGATAVSAGPGIAVSAVTPNAAGTQVTATFTIAAGAAETTRNVRVTTPLGLTPVNAAVTFTVLGPTVTLIAPTTALRGGSVGVTITGTNLTGATSVNAGGGITTAPGSILVTNGGTTLTATLNISPFAAETTRNVTVTTASSGTSPVAAGVTFTVQGPTIASIAPTSGTHGTSVGVTITGTNLTGASAINAGALIGTAPGSIVVNAAGTSLTATLNIGAAAPLTTRTVTVTTSGRGTTPANAAVTFTVN